MKEYQLAELSPEDAKKLTDELQAVLAKYNAEMSVSSNLHILQRVPLVSDAEVVEEVKETKDGD